jgi:hypothetical protein
MLPAFFCELVRLLQLELPRSKLDALHQLGYFDLAGWVLL